MTSVATAMFSVLLTVVAYLFLRLSAQRRLLQQLREEQRTMAKVWRVEQAELSQFIGSKPGPFITIEILNPVELVSQTSIVGGLIGKCAPDMIHRIVVKRTADTMRDQMTENGVQVEVGIHGFN